LAALSKEKPSGEPTVAECLQAPHVFVLMMDFPQNCHPQTKIFVCGGRFSLGPQRHFRGEKAADSDFERKDSVRAEWLRLLP
jgi:hypothetical protein